MPLVQHFATYKIILASHLTINNYPVCICYHLHSLLFPIHRSICHVFYIYRYRKYVFLSFCVLPFHLNYIINSSAVFVFYNRLFLKKAVFQFHILTKTKWKVQMFPV